MEFNGVREAELKNKSIGKSKAGFTPCSNRSERWSNVREGFEFLEAVTREGFLAP